MKPAIAKRISKMVAMLLVLTTVFYVLPLTVFADVLNTEEDAAQVTDANSSSTERIPVGAKAAFEVESLREEASKTFRLEDGSYVAAQYTAPVHKLDGSGEWTDIDNALYASGTDFSTTDARLKFVKKISGNEKIFTLHEGNTKVTTYLSGAVKKTEGVVYNGTDPEAYTELQKMMNLEKLTSRIVYADILDGADIEYVLTSGNIKENIIVKEKKDAYTYTFTLELNNLTASLSDDGDVFINDENGKVKYTIPAPTVFDSAKNAVPVTLHGILLPTAATKNIPLP